MTSPQEPYDPFAKQPDQPPPGDYGQPPGYPPPPPGYGQPPPGYGQPAHDPNGRPGLVTASLVTGILGFLGITAILAIIFGFIGRGKAKERGQKGTTMATWGIVLGFLWIIGLAVIITIGAVASSKENAFDLKRGDCVKSYDRLLRLGLNDLKPVDCSEEHEAQVAGLVDLASEGEDYPGEDRLENQGRTRCAAAVGDVSPTADQDEIYIYPNESLWSDEGNRKILCVLKSDTPTTGSVVN